MNQLIIISGFLLGIAGSLHCVGMCGPLSFSLPIQTLELPKRFIYLLSYQIGRTFTYMLAGFLISITSRPFYWGGVQQIISIGIGLLIMLIAISKKVEFSILSSLTNSRLFKWIQLLIAAKWKQATQPKGLLVLGIVNGLLPCGLVYIALASVLSYGDWKIGTAFMLFFGIGTMPAMLLLGMSRNYLKPIQRIRLQRIAPYFIFAMGAILILRGLDLGIPMLSPSLPSQVGEATVCTPGH